MTNSKFPVLVDSSVWVSFFRDDDQPALNELIEKDLICTNDIILTELLPSLTHLGRNDVVESLEAIPKVELNIDWDLIRRYQQINLKNGVNKVGIPDLIILQQVIEEKLTLMTLDKHFQLMQNHLHFELLGP